MRKASKETILRLFYYLRTLTYFLEEGKRVVSSKMIADFLKISPHQLRKDLSYFGQFGRNFMVTVKDALCHCFE